MTTKLTLADSLGRDSLLYRESMNNAAGLTTSGVLFGFLAYFFVFLSIAFHVQGADELSKGRLESAQDLTHAAYNVDTILGPLTGVSALALIYFGWKTYRFYNRSIDHAEEQRLLQPERENIAEAQTKLNALVGAKTLEIKPGKKYTLGRFGSKISKEFSVASERSRNYISKMKISLIAALVFVVLASIASIAIGVKLDGDAKEMALKATWISASVMTALSLASAGIYYLMKRHKRDPSVLLDAEKKRVEVLEAYISKVNGASRTLQQNGLLTGDPEVVR